MNVLTRLRRAFKAATMSFGGSWARNWTAMLGRTRYDFAGQVGDGTSNSIVVACLNWIARTYPEAPLQLQHGRTQEDRQTVNDHELLTLLRKPNPYYSGLLLQQATVIDRFATGNAYWLKIRAGSGKPVQLWWLPSWMVDPKWSDSGNEYIGHYEYRVDGKIVKYEPADIVHFRIGLDPYNTRKGRSPLASLVREIFSDDEAASFTAALLRNSGAVSTLIAPDDADGQLTPEDAAAIKAEFIAKTSGDNRGMPLVMPSSVKVTPLGTNPKDMDLKALRRIPEERISAVIGVPAIVANLGAGLDRSTFANFAEAREAAYEGTLIPDYRLFDSDLDTQLLPDFDTTGRLSFVRDFSGVRVLQEDNNKLWTRVDTAVRGGWLKVGAAKTMVGMEPEDGDDVYLRPTSVVEVGPDAPEVEPPAALPAPPPQQFLPAPGEPAKAFKARADDRLVTRFRREADHLARPFGRDIEEAFASVASEVARLIGQHSKALVYANGHERKAVEDWPAILQTILESESEVAVLIPPNPEGRWFQPVYERHWQVIAESTFGTVSDRLGIAVSWSLSDPVALDLIAAGGQRITQLDVAGQTRTAITQALRDGREAGDGAEALARRIRGMVEGRGMYPGVYEEAYERAIERGLGQVAAERAGDRAARQYRAETIARTETKTAQNISSLTAYEKSDVVSSVLVFDGDSDGECAAANGQTWTFQEARLRPLGHPRCVRSWAPIVRGGR